MGVFFLPFLYPLSSLFITTDDGSRLETGWGEHSEIPFLHFLSYYYLYMLLILKGV